MSLTPFQFSQIAPDLFIYHGAINTGVLRQGSRAVLIDCDDSLSLARLAELGITHIERVCCTQHRRPNSAGAAALGAPIYAPRAERAQFESASAYWGDFRNRWHLYHCRPGPQAPLQDMPLAGLLGEGDRFTWGAFELRVLDTPGMTDGAVSYFVQPPVGQGLIFSGDVLYGAGQLWDVHSLQKNFGTFSDYHGFLGAYGPLCASLEKLARAGAGGLVPSHGEVIPNPGPAIGLVLERLERLYRNYAAISALNHYFPHLFAGLSADPWRMPPAATFDFPDFILPVTATSFAVRSESGALFLIDCGSDAVLDVLKDWKAQGRCTELEGCWVTHFHDDHVDARHHVSAWTGAPIYAEEHIAEIITHPGRFYLPCISPAPAPVDRVCVHGQTWQWREFELTALHFPGQSYYHAGLLLRGHGLSVLFCGDSFAPTGLDDYTAGNRNLLGPARGYRRCLDLLRQYRPERILNQHQPRAFAFSDEQLDTMEEMLTEREAILSELLPWPHPNYGSDEGWLRAYPYEIEARPGATCVIELRASQHAETLQELCAEPVLPPGWSWSALTLPPPSSSTSQPWEDAWTSLGFAIHIPAGAAPGLQPLPFRVTFAGRYLGQTCHALLHLL